MQKKWILILAVSTVLIMMAASMTLSGCKTTAAETTAAAAETTAAAAETTAAAGEKKKIGVVMIDLVNPFFVDMMNAGNEAGEDYNCEVIWKSADASLEKEISLVENFIEQGVDCILLDPYDAKGVAPVVEKAGKAGIPVVTMGNFVDTAYNISSLYNDFDSLKAIAEIVGNNVGKEGQVALLYGVDGSYVSDQRTAGYMEGIAAFPDIEVFSAPTNWDAATGLKAAQDILAAHPDVKAITTYVDSVTFAVMQQVGEDVFLTSLGGDAEIAKQIRNGSVDVGLFLGSLRVGYWNVALGAKLANGEKLDIKQYLPYFFAMNEELLGATEGYGLSVDISAGTPEEALESIMKYREEFGPGKF